MKNILFVLMASALFLGSCTEKEAEKPNILFIFADDQCYNTINALGNHEVITPNLDRLAHEGMTFTHAYNMGGWNGAVCIASRAMINTGRFIWRAEKLDSKEMMVANAQEGKFWSQLMQGAGYETYCTGKWHVKIDPATIFNYAVHERPGMPGTVPEAYNRPVEGKEDVWSAYDKSLGGFWEGGKHWSEVLGDDAIGFIEQAATKEAPFFMYLAFNAPHDPRQSPKEYVDMYPLENIAVPASFQPRYPYDEAIGCGPDLRDARLAPFPRTEYSVKVHRQEYYAIITHMDAQIGRILEALEKSGKKDNTYIFFTADHGLALGNQGLIGKQNMYDHSIRPPLMVVGPDVPKNKKLDMDVYLQDIMASALELAGVEKPEYVEFNSLMPKIRGEETKSSYESIYCGYQDLQRMIRTDGYKLIAYPYVPKLRLFNLENDPLEMKDLADDPSQQDRVKDMFSKLEKLAKQMEDTLILRNYFPKI